MSEFEELPFSPSLTERTITFNHINFDRLGNKAIVIRKLLDESECQQIISYMREKDREPHFEGEHTMTPANENSSHRNNLRIIVESEDVSKILFSRFLPILKCLNEDIKICDTHNAEEFLSNGFGMFGTWRISYLNSCFRLCKYNTMGHFGPHIDSDYVIDPTLERSLKTFMIYLNDDYEGGETNFLESHQSYFDERRRIFCSPQKVQRFQESKEGESKVEEIDTIFASLKARQGDCLIFDHKFLHEGAQVTAGEKFIMRTDIMYTRTSSPYPSPEAEEIAETQAQALRIYYQGMVLETEGQADEACRLYRKAIKMCPELEFGV